MISRMSIFALCLANRIAVVGACRTQAVRSNHISNAYICRVGIMREIALDDADRRNSL